MQPVCKKCRKLQLQQQQADNSPEQIKLRLENLEKEHQRLIEKKKAWFDRKPPRSTSNPLRSLLLNVSERTTSADRKLLIANTPDLWPATYEAFEVPSDLFVWFSRKALINEKDVSYLYRRISTELRGGEFTDGMLELIREYDFIHCKGELLARERASAETAM